MSIFILQRTCYTEYYTDILYRIYDKNKTTKNISLLIPLWKFVDITQVKNHKEENKLYYFSNILCYCQTCSNDHLYNTTTRLRRLMLNLAKQIPIQSLLYRTTTCLTRPATTFLISQTKKKTSIRNKHKATYTGIRGVFGTQWNIYSAAFFAKKVNR